MKLYHLCFLFALLFQLSTSESFIVTAEDDDSKQSLETSDISPSLRESNYLPLNRAENSQEIQTRQLLGGLLGGGGQGGGGQGGDVGGGQGGGLLGGLLGGGGGGGGLLSGVSGLLGGLLQPLLGRKKRSPLSEETIKFRTRRGADESLNVPENTIREKEKKQNTEDVEIHSKNSDDSNQGESSEETKSRTVQENLENEESGEGYNVKSTELDTEDIDANKNAEHQKTKRDGEDPKVRTTAENLENSVMDNHNADYVKTTRQFSRSYFQKKVNEKETMGSSDVDEEDKNDNEEKVVDGLSESKKTESNRIKDEKEKIKSDIINSEGFIYKENGRIDTIELNKKSFNNDDSKAMYIKYSEDNMEPTSDTNNKNLKMNQDGDFDETNNQESERPDGEQKENKDDLLNTVETDSKANDIRNIYTKKADQNDVKRSHSEIGENYDTGEEYSEKKYSAENKDGNSIEQRETVNDSSSNKRDDQDEDYPDYSSYENTEASKRQSEEESSNDSSSSESRETSPRRYIHPLFPYTVQYNMADVYRSSIKRMYLPMVYQHPRQILYRRHPKFRLKRSVLPAQARQLEMPYLMNRYPTSVAGSNLFGTYANAHSGNPLGGEEFGEEEMGEEEQFGRR
ncbi:keratin, type II cytoskeletal 1-like [Macrosteles quadrilineatus]|uniref:keratin, type II cytoskeletal 1-like n=1 Tax=Macrosteles quadrilineatus TaxID=74068 RepID=UPI0023E2FC8A|nr:keratin, type II cytoskeletal 1-like [Macrosteles quadrilineatus]